MTGLLGFLIIGLIAGWIAGKLIKGSGFGLLGNLLVGCGGAIAGGLLFSLIGLKGTGLIGSLVTAVVGAIVCLFIAAKLKNRSA
ncbi:GlsB/YeaQ/YmgE family stress response membrane protein [Defluviicoccus vanus]|uniref:GlsB/YeaQ/YmgE family stress response membrane protein n=1 Tax=Defluviicoccus vanus TaxID=111831 RepID=A0A7H1MYF3_9PROT|nr:GlsB/YeaQ/YmgE family stress response membrane protein [Defluviicoccus vanus]QNT68489.1 GlsB/YeaQ/YmgE family stress response membrane protein [Defluviicoccus vanus]